MTNDKIKILFLCTGNSCRSQMAEGLTRNQFGDYFEAYSAGIAPQKLNPLAVQVMAEMGIDISSHRTKSLHELLHIPFDYIITVCDHAHEHCPVFPGNTTMIHQNFEDPPTLARHAKTEEAALEIYRRVRNDIYDFVNRLPDILI